jgi:hypothetical protein
MEAAAGRDHAILTHAILTHALPGGSLGQVALAPFSASPVLSVRARPPSAALFPHPPRIHLSHYLSSALREVVRLVVTPRPALPFQMIHPGPPI